MTGVLDSAKSIIDHGWYKLRAKAHMCATNADIEGTKARLEQAEKLTKYAYGVASFTAANPGVADQLKRAADGLETINGGISKAVDVCQDIAAIGQIKDSVDALNVWAALPPGKGNAAAAAAFDNLFGGVARFAGKLPPPLNFYGKLFEQIGISKFFGNMQSLMDPESPNTPKGRALKEIMDSM